MRLFDYIYKIYFSLPNFGRVGKFGKGIDRAMDIYLLKKIFDKIVTRNLVEKSTDYALNTTKRDETYIVSITSFPARISEAWISLECIMRQTFKPDKITLWLAEEQFPDKVLPESLLAFEKRGLEIRFCDDLKSHKKYYYSILENPEANIITLDDDLFYDKFIIENLVALHKKFPKNIVTNRAHKMTFRDGKLRPYKQWNHNVTQAEPSFLLLHTSGAGTLFPPHILPKETFDKDLIKTLSYRSDDVWLKLMSIFGGVKVVTNDKYNKDLVTTGKTQVESLVSTNSKGGGKDQQLLNVMKHFNINISDYIHN
jgi:hypothetical protein